MTGIILAATLHVGWVVGIAIGTLLVGAIVGFFIARWWFKRYLEKNPPINEAMIRDLMRQMGRTPSEKQVKQMMNSMSPNKK